MGKYHGKAANVKFDTTELPNLQSWSLNAIDEVVETSSMGDEWGVSISGIHDFNVTAEGLPQIAFDLPTLLGSSAALELSKAAASGPTITGTAVFSSFTETSISEGTGSISYSFEGNDSDLLAYAASAGTAADGATNAIHGKKCKAVFSAAIVDVKGWSITLNSNPVDTTVAHATELGRTRLGGLKSGTATVTCLADDFNGDAADLPFVTPLTLELHRSETVGDGYYTGTALLTNARYGTNRNELATVEYSFTFTAAVTLAVA